MSEKRRYARAGRTEEEYFQHYAVVTEHGLEWSGPMNGKYGRMAYSTNRMYAHRYSWMFFRGPLSEGEVVDHSHPECPKTCITPGHLAVQESNRAHTHAGWRRGEYANTWNARKPVAQDPVSGKFVKAVQ